MWVDPWVGKIPWRRKWQPTPVSLPGESHGQRSLVGCSPGGHKESDMPEQLNTRHTSQFDEGKSRFPDQYHITVDGTMVEITTPTPKLIDSGRCIPGAEGFLETGQPHDLQVPPGSVLPDHKRKSHHQSDKISRLPLPAEIQVLPH